MTMKRILIATDGSAAAKKRSSSVSSLRVTRAQTRCSSTSCRAGTRRL